MYNYSEPQLRLLKRESKMELLKKEPVKGACYVAPSVDIIDVFAENTFCSGGEAKSCTLDDFGYGDEL